MRNALSGYSPTTIMTGNLTQCTIDLVEFAVPAVDSDTQGRVRARFAAAERLKKFGFPLLGFVIGAFFGAWLTHILGLASIAVPTAAVGALTLKAWKASPRNAGGPHSRASARGALSGPLYHCASTQTNCVEPARQRRHSMIRVRRRSDTGDATCASSGTYKSAKR